MPFTETHSSVKKSHRVEFSKLSGVFAKGGAVDRTPAPLSLQIQFLSSAPSFRSPSPVSHTVRFLASQQAKSVSRESVGCVHSLANLSQRMKKFALHSPSSLVSHDCSSHPPS